MKFPLLTFSLILLFWTCIICAKEHVNPIEDVINSDKEYTPNYQNTKELFSKNKSNQLKVRVLDNNPHISIVARFFKIMLRIVNKIMYSKLKELFSHFIHNPKKKIKSIGRYIFSINFKFVFKCIKYSWKFIKIILLPLQTTFKIFPIEDLFPGTYIFILIFKASYRILQLLITFLIKNKHMLIYPFKSIRYLFG